MWRKEIELVLARQLASYLAMPIFLVDTKGSLLFYNESAEAIIGRPFEEADDIAADKLATLFQATDESGTAIHDREMPLMLALKRRQPTHRRFWMRSTDGNPHQLEATAIPIVGIGGRFLGAFSVFWEVGE